MKEHILKLGTLIVKGAEASHLGSAAPRDNRDSCNSHDIAERGSNIPKAPSLDDLVELGCCGRRDRGFNRALVVPG